MENLTERELTGDSGREGEKGGLPRMTPGVAPVAKTGKRESKQI